MAIWLKRGIDLDDRAENDRSIRDVVEATLANVENNGELNARITIR